MAVLVAITIDSNDDAGAVRDAWSKRGLSEPVAVAPEEFTSALVDEFGPEIVTPPMAPIVLISADQSSARLLPRGLKSADELRAEIEKGR